MNTHAASESACICLFAKAPNPGQAKTRLADALGLKGAASLANAFLLDALEAWSFDGPSLLIAKTGDFDKGWIHRFSAYTQVEQGEGGLGVRLERVIGTALSESDVAIVVGSDIPGIGQSQYKQTMALLQNHDAVIGPAKDGGFYWLALRKCPEGMLLDIPWSSAQTLDKTVLALKAAGMRIAFLAERFDVDTPVDLLALADYLQENHLPMPHTRKVFASLRQAKISVIVPVLNEESRIGICLKSLLAMGAWHEVIVIDGGSEDRTLELAKHYEGVRVQTSLPGRAAQMNCGAKIASGEILLFLHADVVLPENAVTLIEDSIAEGYLAGAFQIQTVHDPQGRHRWWIEPMFKLADMRSRYSALPYGDQALFVQRDTFAEMGGFPPIALFEDLAFSVRLRHKKSLKILKEKVRVSGRRFQSRPFYYLALMNTFPLLYRLGVSPEWLANFYKHTR